MRVAIEMISAGSGFGPAAGGMTTYYEGLSAHLPEQAGIDEVTAFVPPNTAHARLEPRAGFALVPCKGLGDGRLARIAYEQLRLPRLVAGTGADVLLSTHNVRPFRWRGPSVVVLQSLQYFLLSDPIGALRRGYLRAAIPASLRGADRVIAVSEAARADAIEIFGLDPDRVTAVHHGCSPWASEAAARFAENGVPPAPAPMDGNRPYLAIVSSLYGLKNHKRLIEAFGQVVAERRLPHLLAIAGREMDVTHEELAAHARAAGVEDRVRLLGPFPQEHLPALLANADAIVYPSLYETFGHPVLEAFALRRPLLTSNVGGTAEVAAGAAVTVDPTDTDSIAAGLARVLEDESLRADLIEAGTARLGDFSWQRCAAETAAVLSAAERADGT